MGGVGEEQDGLTDGICLQGRISIDKDLITRTNKPLCTLSRLWREPFSQGAG